MKVLFVVTSQEHLGATGKKTGVWLEELAAPYYAFVDAGADVTLATPKGGQPPIDPGSDAPGATTEATERFKTDAKAQAAFASTEKLANVDVKQFDAVFYPGGHGVVWDLAEDKNSIAILNGAAAAGLPIGSVCHGPAAFRHAVAPDGKPLVSGKKVTGFSNSEEAAVGLTQVVPFLLEDMLKANGGQYSHGPDWQSYIVVDGKLATGQNPASSTAVAQALLKLV